MHISGRLYEFETAARFKLFRLFVTGMEVTQAIQYFGSASHLSNAADQGPDNSLRLVSEKPAWVRVYVEGLRIGTVTGTLEVQRRRAGFLWETIATLNPQPPGSVAAVFNPDYVTQRGTLSSTLNFILTADLMCGDLRLIARANSGRWSDSLTTTLSVHLQQTLRLAGVMIAYNGPQSSAPNAPNLNIAAPTLADLQAMSGTALTLFPVRSTANFRIGGTITWSRHLQDPFGTTGCTTNWDALHTAVLNARTADGNQAGWVYYGLLPNGVPMGPVGGCGGGGVSVGPVGAAGTLAHEVAHACGLRHAPCGGAPRPDVDFPAYAPYAMGSIGEYGLNVNTGNVFSPMGTRDFMSYCSPAWISPYDHRILVDNPLLNPRTVCVDFPWWKDLVWEERKRFPPVPIPDPPPFDLDLRVFPPALPPTNVIALIVRVERGEVAEVTHVTRTRVRPEIEGAVSTPLVARLCGNDGEVIAEAALLRVPRDNGGCGHASACGGDPETYVAQSFIPDVAPGASLAISNGQKTLWERKAPRKAVVVSRFQAQLEGEEWLSATWSTSGTEQEAWLRCSLDGQTWRAITTGLSGGEARIETRLLPSGKALLQVVVHDGFFSSTSKSVEIEFPDRPPHLAILHPSEGFSYVEGQSLRLWAAATASNNETIPGETCHWTLDGKKIGSGLDVWISAPKAGSHELGFHAGEYGTGAVAKTTFLTTTAFTAPPAPRGRGAVSKKPRGTKRSKR
jgi:hypothetical protein